MLWFLSLAAAKGFCVDRYVDKAEGRMARDGNKRLAMTVVTLRPHVSFSGLHQPDERALRELHDRAHDACFIAHSVKTDVRCEPQTAQQA